MKKFWSVFLVLCLSLYAIPAGAAEEKEPANRRYFLLNVNPADPSRKIDWGSECLVRIKEDAKVTLSFGKMGHSMAGYLRRGTPVVVRKKDGEALWIYNCGNKILSPLNWRPEGYSECAPEIAPLPVVAEPPKIQEPRALPVIVNVQVVNELPPIKLGIEKKKGFWRSPWPYVIGAVLVGGTIYAFSSKRHEEKPADQPICW